MQDRVVCLVGHAAIFSVEIVPKVYLLFQLVWEEMQMLNSEWYLMVQMY